jgi:OOP family OmpA-OmpF porin
MRERSPLIAGISAVDDKNLQNENSPARLRAAVESEVILFDLAQAEISSRQQASLAEASHLIQRLLQASQAAPGSTVVEIVGHADSSGAEATNVLLSQERATNAMRALVRLGISVKSLRASGVGMSSPLRPETDEQNRQYNRSVTFRMAASDSPQSR